MTTDLLTVVEELGKNDFEKFKFHLNHSENIEGHQSISRASLENATRTGIVDLMLQTYTDDAVKVTSIILKKMKRKDLMKRLEAGFITNDEELRIVMVGKTGSGKSATGNTILGQKTFDSKFSAQSLTVDCKKEKGSVGGQKVAVIDTPGVFDTRYDKDKTTKDLSQCISYAAPGPHVFLVIIRLGRFTEEEKMSVEKIQEIFGQSANKYSMVLFTGGDLLEEEGKTIEEFMAECPDLQELVSRCNNRYHVFNNKKHDNRSQVEEQLQKIRDIMMKNGGSHYTNKMFQAAEREIEEEKERILKEKEEEIRKKEEEIERKLQDKYEKQMKKIQEEGNIKTTEMINELKETHERELREEKEKLRVMYETKARDKAEKSPPFLIRLGKWITEGLERAGKALTSLF